MSTTAELNTGAAEAAVTVETPDLDVTQLEQIDSARVLRRIARNCVAVKISAHGVGYERKLKKAEVKVEGETVPDELLSGATGRLVPPDINRTMSYIANKARRQPGLFGTPFPGGAYLVPVSGAGGRNPAAELFGAVRAVREEYRQKAEEYRPKWDEYVRKLEEENFSYYESMRRWLVDGDTFVAKHTIDMILMPLGGGIPPDFEARVRERVNALLRDPSVSQQDFAALQRLLPALLAVVTETASAPPALLGESASAAWVREAQEATSRAIAESVRTMIQDPLNEFAAALANMEGILARGSRVQASTIANIQAAYTKLQGFSFLSTPDLQRRLQAIAARIDTVNPQAVNGEGNRDAARAVADFLREARETLTAEDTHVEAYGQFMRGLDM